MGLGGTMLKIKGSTMQQENKLTITPFQLADGVYFRLGKRMSKKEMGLVLLNCKLMIDKFKAKHWEDFEVWAFVDSLIYQMKKNQFPLVFRMFYSITNSFLDINKYNEHEDGTKVQYNDWIQNEINRLKNS
jgi:hypothetical protein